MNAKTLGKTGYEAYAKQTGNKTFDGREMPTWDDLPKHVQMAWGAAANKITYEFSIDIVERFRHPLVVVTGVDPGKRSQQDNADLRHEWEEKADRENWPKNITFSQRQQMFSYFQGQTNPVVDPGKLNEVSRKIGDVVAAKIEAMLVTGQLEPSWQAMNAKRQELTDELLAQAVANIPSAPPVIPPISEERLREIEKEFGLPDGFLSMDVSLPERGSVDDFEAIARREFSPFPWDRPNAPDNIIYSGGHSDPNPSFRNLAGADLPLDDEETDDEPHRNLAGADLPLDDEEVWGPPIPNDHHIRPHPNESLPDWLKRLGIPDKGSTQLSGAELVKLQAEVKALADLPFDPISLPTTDEGIRALREETYRRKVMGVDPGASGGDVPFGMSISVSPSGEMKMRDMLSDDEEADDDN